MNTKDDPVGKISELLHEAGEAHHTVYRITNGADDDWASWYSEWLNNYSELPELLGGAPIRSHLTALLVQLDRDFASEAPDGRWEDYYARRVLQELGTA